jgi:hypothetical protein
MKNLYLIFLFILTGINCNSQNEAIKKPAVQTIARSYSDHIVLRFFAGTPSSFNNGMKVGYVIERADFNEGTGFDKLSYTAIKDSPFKRWTDEKWEKEIKEADKKDTVNSNLAGFAYSLTSSDGNKDGNVTANGLESLKDELDKQNMQFAMALIAGNRSKMAAEGLATRINDADVVVNNTYVYRMCINNPTDNNKREYSYIKVLCKNFDEKYLYNVKVISLNEGDEEISFTFPESTEYYAFNIERSDDGGHEYKKLTNTPSLKLSHGSSEKTNYGYGDKNLVNNKKYYYRVLGCTPFADELLLAEFNATPRDKTPPPPPFLKSAENIKPTQILLKWELKGSNTEDLKGFNIKRSNEIRGTFTLISKTLLPKDASTYIDESFVKEGTNYYTVEAVDQTGNTSESLPVYAILIDETPPAKPIIALAVIDTMGSITIKIKPNTEKDFMGYELLKANSKEHEFSIIQQTFKDSLGSTIFVLKDVTTLQTLTKNIYYKVIAYDYHFNASEVSEIIELKRPDTIAPVNPIIIDFAVKESAITISFVNSTSEDAISNSLLRKEVGKDKYDSIFINRDNAITKFIDKDIISGKEYEYTMLAKDDSGLTSKMSRAIQIKTLVNNKLPTPILNGFYDKNTKKVSLNFEVDSALKGKKVNIEIKRRISSQVTWTTLNSVDSDKNKSFDDQINGQTTMIYIIRLIDDNNKTSNYSKQIELTF